MGGRKWHNISASVRQCVRQFYFTQPKIYTCFLFVMKAQVVVKAVKIVTNLLPLLKSSRFHVPFPSPMGVLFTFPDVTTSLSVTQEYLALQSGPC